MKNKHLIKKLHELKATHIEMIDPKQGNNMTCGLASNYSELINCIADLLKTSKKALDGLHVSEEPYITEPEYNIADVIGIAIKLLPFSEMQFIDEAVRLLHEESETKSRSERGLLIYYRNKNIYFFYPVHFPLISCKYSIKL